VWDRCPHLSSSGIRPCPSDSDCQVTVWDRCPHLSSSGIRPCPSDSDCQVTVWDRCPHLSSSGIRPCPSDSDCQVTVWDRCPHLSSSGICPCLSMSVHAHANISPVRGDRSHSPARHSRNQKSFVHRLHRFAPIEIPLNWFTLAQQSGPKGLEHDSSGQSEAAPRDSGFLPRGALKVRHKAKNSSGTHTGNQPGQNNLHTLWERMRKFFTMFADRDPGRRPTAKPWVNATPIRTAPFSRDLFARID
jgi:hypothetical protein